MLLRAGQRQMAEATGFTGRREVCACEVLTDEQRANRWWVGSGATA
jgi:hypothetical protein